MFKLLKWVKNGIKEEETSIQCFLFFIFITLRNSVKYQCYIYIDINNLDQHNCICMYTLFINNIGLLC